MENQSQNENIIDFDRLKSELHESDFDGHTAFQTMSFTQKLAWLSEAAVSSYILKKWAPPTTDLSTDYTD
jgi:hypothetical protein